MPLHTGIAAFVRVRTGYRPAWQTKKLGTLVTLGTKIVVLFLVLGVSFSIGSYAALNFAIYPIFSDFERETSEVSAMRVMQALEGDLHALGIFNGEYAFWDHTYEYAQGQRPEYADENLDDEYWYSIDIDMFLIFDSGKQVVRKSYPSRRRQCLVPGGGD